MLVKIVKEDIWKAKNKMTSETPTVLIITLNANKFANLI